MIITKSKKLLAMLESCFQLIYMSCDITGMNRDRAMEERKPSKDLDRVDQPGGHLSRKLSNSP